MTPSKSRDEKLMLQQDKIAEMKVQQAKGGLPMVPANRIIILQEATTANITTVRQDESEKYVHVFVRMKHDDPNAKRYNLEDRVIPIHIGEFDTKVKQNYFQSYDLVEIIHDPRNNAEILDLQPGKRKPAQPEARPQSGGNSQQGEINKQRAELSAKEKELIAKQDELDKREAELKAKEASDQEQITRTKK